MTMRGLLAFFAAMLAAAPAASSKDELADALANRVAGKPVDCIDKSFVDGPQIINDRTIIYRQTGRRVWRNDLPDACRGMRPMDTIVIELWGNQMCENDHFLTVSPASRIPGAICRLGKFTPYDKPAKAK